MLIGGELSILDPYDFYSCVEETLRQSLKWREEKLDLLLDVDWTKELPPMPYSDRKSLNEEKTMEQLKGTLFEPTLALLKVDFLIPVQPYDPKSLL